MQFEFSRQFPKYSISLDWVTFPSTYIYLFVHFFVASTKVAKTYIFRNGVRPGSCFRFAVALIKKFNFFI
jgi:hypothetical protein